jgi:hypothetical protein
MKIVVSIFAVCLSIVCSGQRTAAYDTITPLAAYNFILGTNTIGGKYSFSKDSKLVEQAKQVRVMGSNILKITLGPNSPKTYGLIAEKSSTTLDLFLSNPDYQKVFDMDFRYIFSWVHTNTGIDWKNGIDQSQEKILYDEMFSFASYLLKRYNNSNKTFFIGNWEGDWMLLPTYHRTMSPSKEHIANMAKWFRIRQQAINDAKKMSDSKNVQLFYYVEVNLVLKGMKGEPCIASGILPDVDVDMVSYSSYEAIKNKSFEEKKATLKSVFEYLEKQMKPRNNFPFSRRVFIGEYGYQANASDSTSFIRQTNETKDIMRIALELNLPFALHWQMYNNEYESGGASKQMSLINEEGKKMPLYFLHQHFYESMNNYLLRYRKENNVFPPDSLFRKKALETLSGL